MKKSIFFIIIFVILNGCAQYNSFLGPTYTMAKSGSIIQTSASMAASYGIKQKTGKSPGEYINSLARKNYGINSFLSKHENIRECQTIHTTSLNKMFFNTLDEIDCFRDPFSILK